MTRRMLTDEELDARIEAMNDRDFGGYSIDESITVITVHGRLANVRWLEVEFNAKKQPQVTRRGTFQEYIVEVSADSTLEFDLIRRLQTEKEDGAGIWFETGPKVN